MIKRLARWLKATFPRPLHLLKWAWTRVDGYKPWKFFRARAAVRAAERASGQPRSPRLVVFVADKPRFREAKLAAGLRSAGMDVVLLYREPPAFDTKRHFSTAEQYRDSWDALQRASAYAPLAYHVFASWAYTTPSLFVRHRPGKVVIDSVDVLAGLRHPEVLRNHYPGETDLEKYSLENADGLCCRSLETQHLKRGLGYRFRGKRIFFPDFTVSDEVSAPAGKGSSSEIHVVHIGNIGIERLHPDSVVGHFLAVAKALTADKVHFHLYGGAPPMALPYEEIYAEYLALEQQTPYMHLHREVPFGQLLREMSGYTFGVHLAGSQLNWNPVGFTTDTSRAHADYCAPSRIFEHVWAGLPLILHDGRFVRWLIRRLGVLVPVDSGFLSRPQEWLRSRLPGPEQVKKLQTGQAQVEVKTHIPRLIDFYRKIAERD